MRAVISPEPALLGFLLDWSMHGYDLYKQAHDRLGMVWHVGQSQLYAIINIYAEQGLIRTRLQTQGARPTKKVLELTAAGHKAFEQWLTQPAHGLREFRVDFFLRLHFARALGNTAVRDLVDRQIAAVRSELENLNQRRAAATEDDGLLQLTRDFRTVQLTTILKWLETNRAQLIRLSKPAALANLRKLTSTRRISSRRKNKSFSRRGNE